MTARFFLHIGLPKTGTTYLQGILWENKALLRERGVLLPGPTRRRHLLASVEVREDPRLARRPGVVGSPWQDLVDEVLAWPGDALVSHEFFAAASAEQVRRMVDSLRGREVHVVVTARAMSDLGLSRWQEWVKNGGTTPLDDYPVRRRYDPTNEWGWGSFDLAEVLERWGSVVDPARIHVLPLRRGAGPEQLWQRFAAVFGVDPTGFDVPAAPANASLGVVEVELLRRVNRHLHDFRSSTDRGKWIRGFLAEGKVLRDRPERFRAGDAKERELAERGRRAVDMLRTGGFDLQGRLSDLEPVPAPGLRSPDEVTEAELLDSATEAMASLLRAVRDLTEERDALLARSAAPPGRLARGVERIRGAALRRSRHRRTENR